ncbi:MAG: penicillin-insensitive murein endopeptidase [Sandaracinaceae bacterium]|nr:penicillin-insensitive murein endopeptidase [Sandaracinaceae bacterium]
MARWLLVLACVAHVPRAARAQPSAESSASERLAMVDPPAAREARPAPSPSTSHGVPDRGRLSSAVPLEPTPHLFVRQSRGAAQFGTAELVGLIQRAAAAVAQAHPGPRLVAGDLSRARGGRAPPHRSHQSGRDADLGLYVLDASGQPATLDRFVSLRRDGCGEAAGARYCFDVERSWALVAAMVSDPIARVQYVLIAPDLRRRLLAEGERRRAPAELLARVALVTEPHAGSHSHRSHFHVRIYCPPDDRPGCIDEPPYHAWYEGTPAPPTPAVRGMRARQRRARAREQARAAARAARHAARARPARRAPAAPPDPAAELATP